MSVNSYQTVIAHLTDANFRAWGLAFKNALTAIGLTNTADSGQIDWTSVTIPLSTATVAGYEMWRFNDALQATDPIFIKFEFGTGSSIDSPSIKVSVGQSSDGSGNLNSTGCFTVPTELLSGTPVSTVTQYPSYFCYNTTVGFLGIMFKLGGNGLTNPGLGFFMVGRSCSSAGAATGTGATVYTPAASFVSQAEAQSLDFDNQLTYAKHQNYAVVVGNVLGSAVGANVQLYLNWAHYPRVEPVNWTASVISSEIGRVLFLTAIVGAVTRTYLGAGINSPYSSPGSNQVNYSFGMLYE